MSGSRIIIRKCIWCRIFPVAYKTFLEIYSQIERISTELGDVKNQIQELNNKITQLSSAATAQPNKEEKLSL
jgi:hypothetical protein